MTDAVVTGTSWLQRVGLSVDEVVNAIFFNGDPHQTVSVHAAVAARDGERWACIFCRVLDKIIEPGHCANQFNDEHTSVAASIRSALAFATALALVGLACFGIVHGARSLFP